jgi:glyoxylate/hydroxypyruvate reductase A
VRRLCVLHHRHQDWVPALREAEPRLDIRGWHPKDADSVDLEWLARAEALFCWRIPPGFLRCMPALAWVQNSGAGVDHLVADPSIPRHVPITRADGEFGFWMARYVLAHLLHDAQRIEACRAAQAGRIWNPKLLPEDLWRERAVVLGFGRIGRRIGIALKAIGMEVTGIVRTARDDPDFPLVTVAALPTLLASARLWVLAAPSTPTTRRMLDGSLLAMGNGRLLLVNIGRGDLIDPDILRQALDRGSLGHAVLDVFPEEPLAAESPLWDHPRITVTPHHSGPSTPRALIPDILENLRRFAEGLPIRGAVDRERGY